MSYKRNRLGWCKGVKVKKFVKLRWKLEAVSMVLFFSSGFIASVMHYKVVIPFKILLVEEFTVFWIIGCSVFVVVSQKRNNAEKR